MTTSTLVSRSLWHYWRASVAVILGVATAVAVLGGALIVGDSVRGTLRDLALSRIGRVETFVGSSGFFRAALVDDLSRTSEIAGRLDLAPIITVEGFVTAQTTGKRAGRVRVYGVDDRFWQLQHLAKRGPEARRVLVSPALAAETGAEPGQPILIRVELPSEVPLESLHGRKDDPGRTVRATVAEILSADALGEFTLSQEQGSIRAVFLPLGWLGEQLEVAGRANGIVAGPSGTPGTARTLQAALRGALTAADAGFTVAVGPSDGVINVGADAGLLDDYRVDAVRRAAATSGLRTETVFTYLANTIHIGSREIPYSLIAARETGADDAQLRSESITGDLPPVVVNEWAAKELGAKVGDVVELDYYRWVEPGRLETEQAPFRLRAVVPIGAADRDLAPVYKGITESPTLEDWDPPFPLDLKRVRPVDEGYWRDHRTTPKAFIALTDGQRLWGSRYGRATSVRVYPSRVASEAESADAERRFESALRAELDPARLGFLARDVRAEALAASGGVTDFGQYFVYFSFFLVVSALVLAALFFKLGVEERVREVGLLQAAGARDSFVRRTFLTEAVVLALAGGALGAIGAVAYASGIVALLGSWWVDAVGTTALAVHVRPAAIAAGVLGGVAAAILCTWATLRGLSKRSPRSLLAGAVEQLRSKHASSKRPIAFATAAAAAAAVFVAAGVEGMLPAAGAFFGAASFMLIAGLASVVAFARVRPSSLVSGNGGRALIRLGIRNAALRPAASALAVSVIASAIFILLAVDAFRKDDADDIGVGGYSLVADSLLPIAHDLSTREGRAAAGLADLGDVIVDGFRVRPGDDTSCLNLYQPSNPRIVGASQAFIGRNRFAFADAMPADERARANPWVLLNAKDDDGAVPAIVDANSLAYVLHKSIGDVLEIPHARGKVRLRFVAALRDSLFQSEFVIADTAFVRLFPEYEGHRFFLIQPEPSSNVNAVHEIEDQMSAFGVDVMASGERLQAFHRVENTYLATFQTLGGLGLLVGTLGLSAIMLRNVVERRRELALLAAVGYRPWHIGTMLFAESGVLLVAGLVIGASAALVASVPALVDRGGRLPFSPVGAAVVGAVLVAGLLSTAIAARAATRRPLLGALRSE